MFKNYTNLILIGHTGSGKTTIANKLSKILNINFFDSDNEIENILSLNINNIFKLYGEQFFREKENEFLIYIKNKSKFILSTGAGILTKKNIKIINKIGIIIYIKLDIKECIKRIINAKNRPLLNNYIKNKNYIDKIFKNRESLYKDISNIIIDANNKNINKILKDILFILNKNLLYKNEKNKNIFK
ncbi:shikimate kinase [endosymbiont of Euscepes postfasciatus]|uniref:shikimate kinase n=1 Tax=endosymbiont of Euscepes postfasciatus TaxID=650377 RepID=UPI000DC73299|nr:shikimate kinase [endosymbiont of Euscepes postfasciatus]BBA84652.1 shikimate kinase [endosymbiont of Euscepes postfasciatus]